VKNPADTTVEGGIRVISATRAALIARVSKLDWLTTDEAALYCRVGVSTFERMVRDLPIKFVRPAGPKGDRRFYRSHLDSALLARVENSPAA